MKSPQSTNARTQSSPQKPAPTLQEKLQEAQEQAGKWGSVALSQSLSPLARQAASNLARSWAAAKSLYEKAQDHQPQENETPDNDPLLDQLLRLQPPGSTTSARPPSTNSATSASKT